MFRLPENRTYNLFPGGDLDQRSLKYKIESNIEIWYLTLSWLGIITWTIHFTRQNNTHITSRRFSISTWGITSLQMLGTLLASGDFRSSPSATLEVALGLLSLSRQKHENKLSVSTSETNRGKTWLEQDIEPTSELLLTALLFVCLKCLQISWVQRLFSLNLFVLNSALEKSGNLRKAPISGKASFFGTRTALSLKANLATGCPVNHPEHNSV